MRYRPEIDGLRAVAVIPVILYHAGLAGFAGGYVGVDVFFVISGYLITSIIVDDHEAAGFSVLRFYERRARRLLPALYVVMAACLLPAWLWLLPRDLEEFAHSLAYVTLFVSNVYFAGNTGYFDAPSHELPLLHTWSLAVEEQFYLVFPFLLILLWRIPSRTRAAILGVMLLASLGWAEFASRAFPEAGFFLLPSRFWELLAGALIALHLRRHPMAGNTVLSALGLALILAAVAGFADDTPYPSLWTLVPVAGTGLVILYARTDTLTARALGHPVPLGLGLVSYSAYLWHQPLFAFARVCSVEPPADAVMLVLAALSLGLAYLTWRFVEQPFRRKRAPVPSTRGRVFALAGTGMAAFLALGAAGEVSDGFGARYAGLTLADYRWDNRAYQIASWEPLARLSGVADYRNDGAAFERQAWFAPDGKPGLVVTGDSHGKDLYNTLMASSAARRYQVARYGIRPGELADPGSPFYRSPNFAAARIVMIAPRWQPEDIPALGSAIDLIASHGKIPVVVLNTPEFTGDLTTNLTDSIVIPILRRGEKPDPEALARMVNTAHAEDLARNWDAANPNAAIAGVAAAHGAIVLDRRAYICPAACTAVSPRLEKYIYDYGHLSLEGSAWFGREIDRTGWLDALP